MVSVRARDWVRRGEWNVRVRWGAEQAGRDQSVEGVYGVGCSLSSLHDAQQRCGILISESVGDRRARQDNKLMPPYPSSQNGRTRHSRSTRRARLSSKWP